MSRLFNKLPGYRNAPPGLERTVLRHLPWALVLGSLLVGVPSVLVRWLPGDGEPAAVAKAISLVDFAALGVLGVYWTALLTIAIHAFTIMVMKGPAYVADAYPLSDADAPAKPSSSAE